MSNLYPLDVVGIKAAIQIEQVRVILKLGEL